jgi:hypothetical protein
MAPEKDEVKKMAQNDHVKRMAHKNSHVKKMAPEKYEVKNQKKKNKIFTIKFYTLKYNYKKNSRKPKKNSFTD